MRLIRNWYQLLEGSGLVASDSGPGQAVGTLTTNITWAPFYHPPGTLYCYKGVVIGTSYSVITSAAAAGFNGTEGSVEMLVKPSWNHTDGAVHYLWNTYGGAGKYFRLFKYTDNRTYLTTNSLTRGGFEFPWVAGTVYHVVLNWGTNQLFINGVLANDFSDGTLGAGATTFCIGDAATISNSSFSGTIYYCIVRDVPLTLAEIAIFRAMFLKQYIPD
jgi:hypothetical protein